MLDDRHIGIVWYPKPQVCQSIVVDGSEVLIEGTFRHKACDRMSGSPHGFQGLTCSMCAAIPNEDDFRKRVIREDKSVVKRGSRTTAAGIRVGYLSHRELSRHNRDVSKKFRLKRLQHSIA